MADNSQGSGPLRHGHLRHLVPAPDGTHRPSAPGRVHRHARDPRRDKHILATEAGWRLVSTIFSIGCCSGAAYAVLWYEVMNK